MKRMKWMLIACMTILLSGCGHTHTWEEATCTAPKTCSGCGETEGEPLGHNWSDATCEEPKKCSTCSITEGDAMGHSWIPASCTEAKHCSTCNKTEGEPLAHDLTEANYQEAAVCKVCGEHVGEPLQADCEKYQIKCDAELDVVYPLTTRTSEDPEIVTTGTVYFSGFEILEDTDGYERRNVYVICEFSDENTQQYGATYLLAGMDYYNFVSFQETWNAEDRTFTVNYNGVDYPDCCYEIKHDNYWAIDELCLQAFCSFRVPKGFDGIVLAAGDYANGMGDVVYFNEYVDEDTHIFRLKEDTE